MKVGIFGGTFNPPHKTHISLAESAIQQLKLDKLIVMPCGIPPHKETHLDSQTRVQLSHLAFDGFAEVSEYEIEKQGKSYTVETLREIKSRYADAELFFIIGGDSFEAFDTWYRPKEIASLCTLAVAARGKKILNETCERIVEATGVKFGILNVEPDNVSSSEIRLRYEFGLSCGQFVTDEVNDFILKHGLYSQFRPITQKLESYLTNKRYMHTFYVVKRGLELADDSEKNKVFLACLLHDCAKYITPERYSDYGFVQPSDMPDAVVHSFLGPLVAERDFGITDAEILDAIRYHTTGCPAMTRLEKIVYIADKTEETRPYELAHLTCGTVDEQFKKCLIEANRYTNDKHGGTSLYYLSAETLDYYSDEKSCIVE